MKKILYFSIGIFFIASSALAEADVNSITIGQDIQAALQDEKVNQASFDAAYQKLSQDSYLDVANRIMIQKDDLINALQLSINQQASYGNDAIVLSLKRMLNYINSSSNTFTESYAANAPTTVVNDTDLEALQVLQQNISFDLVSVNQATENFQESLTKRKEEAISYIRDNSAFFYEQLGILPIVPDGTIATIFTVDETHGCYYVNAGDYSGVGVGNVYGIIDLQGQYIGNLQIIKSAETYSVGVLINTDNIPVNSKIPDLLTKTVPPPDSSK